MVELGVDTVVCVLPVLVCTVIVEDEEEEEEEDGEVSEVSVELTLDTTPDENVKMKAKTRAYAAFEVHRPDESRGIVPAWTDSARLVAVVPVASVTLTKLRRGIISADAAANIVDVQWQWDGT